MRKGESFFGGRRKGVPEEDGGGEERVFEGGGSESEGEKVVRVVVPEGMTWGSDIYIGVRGGEGKWEKLWRILKLQ